MEKKEKKDFFDFICETPIRCFLFLFIGSYLIWWLILDGPAKWDKYFSEKMKSKKEVPIILKDPLKRVDEEILPLK